MSRPNQGKSFIVSTEDLENVGGTGGLDETAVNALIATALADYAKKADVYTKAESDDKFQPKA